jgi:hypothetical protein
LVTTSRRKAVSVCRAATVAPGSTPPPSSTTVPLIWAVLCADALNPESEKTRVPTSVRRVRFI